MKSRIGIGILSALGLTFALASTALADDADGQQKERHQRREHRQDRADKDENGDHARRGRRGPRNPQNTTTADRMKQKVERMRAFEAAMRDQREKQRADADAWRRSRDARAREHRREIGQTWGGVYKSQEGRAELARHADRMARLHRARDIAQDQRNASLLQRIDKLIDQEIARDAQALAALRRGGRK